MHRSDWESVVDDPKKAFLALPASQQHILEQDDGKKRWVERMTNDEFRMSNWLNFGLRTSAFALPLTPPSANS